VIKPVLDGMQVVIWADREPAVTDVTKDSFGVEFPDIWVFGEEGVSLLECVDVLIAGRGLFIIIIYSSMQKTYIFLDKQLLR
jgi:hypothetical protein